MTQPTDAVRHKIQNMIKDELMVSWRTGFTRGMNTAQLMTEAVRDVAAARRHDSLNDCERAEFDAQISALNGLISALETATAEHVQPEPGSGDQQ